MSTIVSSVLAELETRAGASDADREAWLAERRNGVTATEVRDLVLKGPTFRRELIEKKLGVREEPFIGNAYTEWGKFREPIIAAKVQTATAIAPESRVFRAADNPRFLCSPDGLGVDFDEQLRGCEIKTAGEDIGLGTEAFERKGYLLQILWSMRVMGARRWLYVWEERLPVLQPREGEPVFEPGELRMQWVEWDEAKIRELEAVAVDFLVELDAARAARDAGEGPVVDEDLDTLAVNLLRFRREESEAKRAKETSWNDLLQVLGERDADFSQESTLARITYTARSAAPVEVVDNEAAIDSSEAARKRWEALLRARAALAKKEEAWAAHAAKFLRSEVQVAAARLTVTAVKPAKEKKQ